MIVGIFEFDHSAGVFHQITQVLAGVAIWSGVVGGLLYLILCRYDYERSAEERRHIAWTYNRPYYLPADKLPYHDFRNLFCIRWGLVSGLIIESFRYGARDWPVVILCLLAVVAWRELRPRFDDTETDEKWWSWYATISLRVALVVGGWTAVALVFRSGNALLDWVRGLF